MEHALQYGQQQQQQQQHHRWDGPSHKPNIFDLQAQEGTKKLLHPLADGILGWLRGGANERAIRGGRSTLPNLRHWLAQVGGQAGKHFEEIYLFLDVLVETSFLWLTDASLCETYYGIVRRDTRMEGSCRLGSIQRLISVFELSVLPYLFRRLKRRLLRVGAQTKDLPWALKLAPYAHAGYSLANWLIKLLYVFKADLASASLLSLLSGIRYSSPPPPSQSAEEAHHQPGWGVLGTLMLGLRFIQWWRENQHQLTALTLEDGDGDGQNNVPPPPQPRGRTSLSPSAPTTKGVCPICGSTTLNRPVALPTGYICCAHCLQASPQYRDHRQCPLTGVPLRDASLIRLLYIV